MCVVILFSVSFSYLCIIRINTETLLTKCKPSVKLLGNAINH